MRNGLPVRKRLVCASHDKRLLTVQLTRYKRQQQNGGAITDAVFKVAESSSASWSLQGYPTRVSVTRGGCRCWNAVRRTNHGRVLQKLAVTQLVKKFCTCSGTRRFSSVFTRFPPLDITLVRLMTVKNLISSFFRLFLLSIMPATWRQQSHCS